MLHDTIAVMVTRIESPDVIRQKIQKHKTEIKRLQIVLRLAELDRKERPVEPDPTEEACLPRNA